MSRSVCVTRKCLLPSIALLLLIMRVSEAATQCTWTDQADKGGQQAEADDSSYGEATLDACKTACEARDGCMAVSFRSSGGLSVCRYFHHEPTVVDDSGTTYSVKTCTEATSPTTTSATSAATSPTTTSATSAVSPPSSVGGCTMTQTANTRGSSDGQIKVNPASAEHCETFCKSVSECTAYSHDSGTCKLYATTTTTSSSAGSVYGSKTSCGGKMCCFTTQQDTAGGSNPALTLTNTVSSCESVCVSSSTCKAVAFTSGSCSLYTSLPDGTISDSQSTYSAKSCPSGATDGSYTLTTVCQGAGTARVSLSLLFVLALAWTNTIFTL